MSSQPALDPFDELKEELRDRPPTGASPQACTTSKGRPATTGGLACSSGFQPPAKPPENRTVWHPTMAQLLRTRVPTAHYG